MGLFWLVMLRNCRVSRYSQNARNLYYSYLRRIEKGISDHTVTRIGDKKWRVLPILSRTPRSRPQGWIVEAKKFPPDISDFRIICYPGEDIVQSRQIKCTCPDATASEDYGRNWAFSKAGLFYPCKHIIAVLLKENVDFIDDILANNKYFQSLLSQECKIMSNAVFTTSHFLGDGTQLTFINNLNSAMLTAGFTLLDSYTNTGLYRVWNCDTGGGFTFSNLILEFGFSSTNVNYTLKGYSNWDTSTKTGSNASSTFTSNSSPISSLSSSFNLYTVSHPEIRGVFIYETTTPRLFVGYLRPDPSLPGNAWFSQNAAPLAFILSPSNGSLDFSRSSQQGALQSISSLRPHVNLGNVGLTPVGVTTGNYVTGNMRAMFPANIVTTAGELVLFFSSDLVLGGASGLALLDYSMIGATKYSFFSATAAGENVAKLFIKTA